MYGFGEEVNDDDRDAPSAEDIYKEQGKRQ
jgi:hypothetical protein